MELEKIDIHELLPQQEPFVMVDTLTFFDEKTTSTKFTVRKDNIFVEDGVLNECAIAENIAQTCAARLGYINKYILKRGIQIGFIGGIKNLMFSETPKVGDVLDTTIYVTEQVMEITLVNATVKCCDRIIATAEMKIAMAEEVKLQ
jgi:predicted hotdog family 3-hydroxylacyl-ACP dehydratase